MEPEPEAFYIPTGEGVYESTRATSSPWDETLQHGGPPAGLLARAIEHARTDESLAIARFTANMLGGIPQGSMRVDTRVLRPGRRVELVEASLWTADRLAVTASAWLIRSNRNATRDHWQPTSAPPIPPARPQRFFEGVSPNWGYGRAIDWRFVTGSYEPGPASVWTRLRIPLVAGERTSPVQRLLVVADSTNGLSGTLPMREWYFIPPTMTATIERPPEGDWMHLEAHSTVGPNGIGAAHGTMADDHGPFATIAQPLMIARR